MTVEPAGPRRRIGIDASRAFGERRSGTEHYATELIRGLLDRDRHDYRLYLRQAPLEAPPRGAELRVLRAPRLWTHSRLLLELLRRPPELLFVPAHVLPLYTRPPSVVTVHDLGYEQVPEAHPPAQLAYLRWSTLRHVRLATRLIADSACTRNDLVERYGADPEKVDVVLLAADADMRPAAPDARRAIRAKLGIGPEQAYLLHVGTNRPRKNLVRLVEAFGMVAADAPELQLVLAGLGGRADPALDRTIRRLGLEARVQRPGYLPRRELPALYSAATALAMPSLYEGFGLPVLEAMACGTAVVCSEGSSLPEVGGEAALYVDPWRAESIAEGLRGLLLDAGLRARLEAAGPERAAGFSWRRTARETEAVLVRAIEEASGRRSGPGRDRDRAAP